MADLVEIAAVKVKGGKITDRWSTLVNPGRPIVGNQMHGITDADVKKAPSPAEAAKQALAFIGDALDRRPLGRLRPRLPRGRARRRHAHRAGPLPRHADDRPRGLSGPRELQAADAVELLRHRARPGASGAARRRGDRQPADLVRQRPAGSDRRRSRRASPTRSARPAPVATARRLPEAARREARVSKSLFNLVHKKTARQLALDEGIRMDGRGLTELRQISVDVGLLPRAHGSGLFTRGETQVLTIATLGSSSDVQRIDTISPKTEKRYIHHYNFPPVFDRREQADARPQPARHRPRQPGRAGAHPGPAEPRGLPVRHPARVRVHVVQRLDLDGLDLRLDPRPDGRGRADLGTGRRCGDGPHQRARRPVRRPDRHPRQGGLGRRHGLQGDRHAGRHHRPADGHQGPGHQRGDHPRRPQAGPGGPPRDPRQDDRGHARGARRR